MHLYNMIFLFLRRMRIAHLLLGRRIIYATIGRLKYDLKGITPERTDPFVSGGPILQNSSSSISTDG
jgi:hypothetical protein